jgi:hypothetical protein
MDVIDGSGQNALPCPPKLNYGSKVLGSWINPRDLVIPGCQSRALWAGLATGYAEPREPKTVIVESGFHNAQKKTGLDRYRGVLSQKAGFFT